MGRYVGGKWHEELPSAGPQDQIQWNNVPVPSSGGGQQQQQQQPTQTTSSNGQRVYQTKNGPKTAQQMDAELRAVGWGGPAPGTEGEGAISNAYAQTTGGNVQLLSSSDPSGGAQKAPGYVDPNASGGQQNQNQGQIGDSLQKLLNALASGNQAAAAEAAREFDATFGLDKDKFAESVRQYNQNFGLAQANLTGSYNGQDTLAKQKQDADTAAQAAGLTGWYNAPGATGQGQQTLAGQLQQANLSGMYNGSPTEAARQFNVTAGNEINKTIASAQNDPFRQLEITNNARGAGGILNGASGTNGVNGLPRFGAINGSAQGTGALGMARQNLSDLQNSQHPNAQWFSNNVNGMNTDNTANSVLGQFRVPTDVVARNYITADQGTKNMITSAISQNTGLDQSSVENQIKAQLPQAGGPAFGIAQI